MHLKGEKGFTLVEVIVVAAIIAILAGILVPMIFSQIDEAKLSRAKADARSLSSAIYTFRKDVGQWPNCGGATVLFGTGANKIQDAMANPPLGYDLSGSQTFVEHLMENGNNLCYGDMWKGPYFGSVDADPWGNPYFMDATGFAVANQAVLIISAGPNGVVDTASAAKIAGGDDIVIRVK